MEDKNLKSNFELIKNDYNAYLKTLFSSLPLLNYFYHLPNSLKKVILKILSKNPNKPAPLSLWDCSSRDELVAITR